MKQLKTILSFSFSLIFLFSSCQKDDSKQIKDYNYFLNNISSDENLLKINSLINYGSVNSNSSYSRVYTQSNDIKLFLSNEFPKEKIENRAKEMNGYFLKFIEKNPEFNNFSKEQKTNLLLKVFYVKKGFEISNLSINPDSGDCMGYFNHMANVCFDNFVMDCIGAFASVDPLEWPLNALNAEYNYRGCLADAAEGMDVCQNGGYVN
jgi:hypothetical protein